MKLCANGCGRPRYRQHRICNQCRCRKDAVRPIGPLAPVDTGLGRFWLTPTDMGHGAPVSLDAPRG